MKVFIYVNSEIETYENVKRITFDRKIAISKSNHEGCYTLELEDCKIFISAEKVYGIEIIDDKDSVLSKEEMNNLLNELNEPWAEKSSEEWMNKV